MIVQMQSAMAIIQETPNDKTAQNMLRECSAILESIGLIDMLPDMYAYVTFWGYLPDSLSPILTKNELKNAFRDWKATVSAAPATRLRLQVRQLLERSRKTRAQASDTEDINHLAALPYVDIFFADAATHDRVRSSINSLGLSSLIGRCFPSGQFKRNCIDNNGVTPAGF